MEITIQVLFKQTLLSRSNGDNDPGVVWTHSVVPRSNGDNDPGVVQTDELFLDDKGEEVEEEEELLADQSYHARQLLRQLDSKITNKTQAMRALLSSHKLERDKVRGACFIGLNVDFTGVVSTVGGGGVLRERKKNASGCGGG